MKTSPILAGNASKRIAPEYLDAAVAAIEAYDLGLREALLIVRHGSEDFRRITAHRIAAREFLGGLTENAMSNYRFDAGENDTDPATRQQFQYDLSIARSRITNRIQAACVKKDLRRVNGGSR